MTLVILGFQGFFGAESSFVVQRGGRCAWPRPHSAKSSSFLVASQEPWVFRLDAFVSRTKKPPAPRHGPDVAEAHGGQRHHAEVKRGKDVAEPKLGLRGDDREWTKTAETAPPLKPRLKPFWVGTLPSLRKHTREIGASA